MLWSLVKIILFICIIAGLTLGAGHLMDTGGGVRVAIGTIEFNLGPLQAVIAALVILAAFWIALKIAGLGVAVLRFLNGDETAISRWFDRNRERRGFEALADGLMALASGEGRTAMSKAARAERYLKRPELTNLITAQAAEMAGDTKKAQEVYKTLLQDDRTKFVGVRGIMKQKLVEGDTDTAAKLAEKAFALKPRHEETQDVLLRLQADKGDWKGARKTLNAKLKYGALPRNVHRRRDAVLALGAAGEIVAEDATIEAREAAIEANRLSPDLVPAAAMAARSYIDQAKPRYAARVIKKAWTSAPHPDLAAAFAAIEPDETPEARIKRFAVLTKLHPNHAETKMLKAELFIAAEKYSEARTAMGTLADDDPTARSLTIMAAIERGEGATDSVVKGYLAGAVNASRGPQWVCDSCQNVSGLWAPVCANCGAFDSLSWRVPTVTPAGSGQSAAMLPLIVGAPEEPEDVAPEPVEEVGEESVVEVAEAEVLEATDETPPRVNGVDPSIEVPPQNGSDSAVEEARK
ncbi:MAG: heme biosynthesis HemY N-terminal domain-containing protein [Pseudomonadota bacterium]